jgi:hypothetical protein
VPPTLTPQAKRRAAGKSAQAAERHESFVQRNALGLVLAASFAILLVGMTLSGVAAR